MQNPVQLVGTFITNLTDLLISPDTQIRDIARDALGTELSPRLYSRLLKHLDEYVYRRSIIATFLILNLFRTIRAKEEAAGFDLTESYRLFLDQVCEAVL